MAKAQEKETQKQEVKETKYIVGDQGYLYKKGKVYKTGEEIFLTPEEYENVKDKVKKAGNKDEE